MAAEEKPLYIVFPDDAPVLLWTWNKYGRPGEVRAYIKARLDSEPTDTLKFLGTYVSPAWEMESGLPHKSDFSRENYDAIAIIIEPEAILTHLKLLYGVRLDSPEYYHSRETPLEERIAQQFAFIHKKVQAGRSQSAT
jgi:hypothetical protein